MLGALKQHSCFICLLIYMCREGVGALEQNAACLKFLDQILPEAFRKLLTSNATSRWLVEIQVMLLACCYFSLKFHFFS